MSYRHKCQMHPDCLIATKLADWKILDGCFLEEPRVSASDIDGVVCQNGSVLFLEKKSIGQAVSWAQRKTFRTLAAQGNTVIVAWWNERNGNDLCRIETWNLPPFLDEKPFTVTLDDYRYLVRQHWWLKHYNGKNV